MKVAVVGAGIAGASAARSLVSRGHDTTLYEQFAIGHAQGSSHGRSRIVRKAYPDPFYTQVMAEAYPLWRELERATGRRILHECGLLSFGPSDSADLQRTLDGLRDLGVAHERVDPGQARSLSPRLRLQPGEFGIYTPEAGWVEADTAIAATLEIFEDRGGRIVEGRRLTPEEASRDHDAFVLCAGPWLREMLNLPVRVTLQTFGYVDDGRGLGGPAWIDYGDDLFYGFPSEPGRTGFKIGIHRAGGAADPNNPDRTPPSVARDQIIAQAERRFGFTAGSAEFHGCLYTSTMNEDFLLGRHLDNGFFASACSGHGFKFGPWIGEKLADFVEGLDRPETFPRFCGSAG